jgi:GxxExxY protein
MQPVNTTFVHPELSYKIIGSLYQVDNELGSGYQEKYYQRGTAAVFTKNGLKFVEQVYVPLVVQGAQIGCYYLDFLVEGTVVVEIKRGNYFVHTNIQQVNAYLKSTGLQLGILANFTDKGVRIKRIVNIK